MPENAIIPDGIIPDAVVLETAKERFERERFSRRQALKRLGMTSAMATFALFSVDDLARMVGKAMQQRAGDNKVAAQIAQEFQQAGITLANAAQDCADCCNHYNNIYDGCWNSWCWCMNHTNGATCYQDVSTCLNNAQYDWGGPTSPGGPISKVGCFPTHCAPIGGSCAAPTIQPCTFTSDM